MATQSRLDIPYRTVDGTTLYLDAVWPRKGGPYPLLVLVHGGSWRAGDEDKWQALASIYAEAGWSTFAVSYRLSPPGGTWHYPAHCEDVDAAVGWCIASAASFRGDPSRVAMIGASAGGHLVTYQALHGENRPKVVASLSGPQALYEMDASSDPNSILSCENFIGCALTDCPDLWHAASPRDAVLPGAPPMYLANADAEVIPLAQATTMADALTAAGVPNQLRVVAGSAHALRYESQVRDEMLAFLRAHI